MFELIGSVADTHYTVMGSTDPAAMVDAADPAVALWLVRVVELDETTEHVDRMVPGADSVVQLGEAVECASFARS